MIQQLLDFPPVSAIVYNAYGRYVYRVLDRNCDNPFDWEQIEVMMLDHPRTDPRYYREYPGDTHRVGDVWSHSTRLSSADEILNEL